MNLPLRARLLLMYPAIALAFMLGWFSNPAMAQMRAGAEMPGFDEVFGLTPAQKATHYSAVQINSSLDANVLWPGDSITFTYRVTNKTGQPIHATGRAEVVRYVTQVPAGDIWVPHVLKMAGSGSVSISVDLPASGSTTIQVTPPIPAQFGGYAIILDLGPEGRAFGSAVVRTVTPDPGRVWQPTQALDMPWPFEMSEAVTRTFARLGVKACRMGASYTPTTSPNFERDLDELKRFLDWSQQNGISVMLTVGAGSAPQPLGRGRPWLNDDNSMKQGVKEDLAWLPAYDEDFQKWTKIVASRWGWPKGPVNAIELWNEPWEGVSISGWGADMPRYREIYEHMARGVVLARKEAGVKVLIGGASSSSNTLDKLFGDGSDKFLPWLDFCSIHYQEMGAVPSLIPAWMHRTGEYGRVKVWDTESWVANSEDRIAAVIASMRAQGQDRAMGVYGGNVYQPLNYDFEGKHYSAAQAWAPAAAVAATEKFIGQRTFRELLFKNGLPWVFVFNGLPGKPDDGSVVVVGDLGGVYDRNKLLFRTVYGLKNAARVRDLQGRIAALPATATKDDRQKLQDQLAAAQVLTGAHLTIPSRGGKFVLYDFYGNPVPSRAGHISVPLNGLGYFLRSDGSPGSFARLLNAIRGSRIDGYQPVEIVCHDLLAPLGTNPTLRITFTNILNRPISGKIALEGSSFSRNPQRQTIDRANQSIRLAPHESRTVDFHLRDGVASPDNTYPITIVFDAGPDGSVTHREALHVNAIARKTITVDGVLDDWTGVLPQVVSAAGLAPSLTEQAWLPFKTYDASVTPGLATAYLAYDADNLYFAARIADSTPYPGNVRFASRDDDAYFYPATVTDRGKTLEWPAGVRRFSYRKDPDTPAGNGTDNVQIAFNVLPLDQKPWYPNPPGTMPRFMAYWDTDYEFALNSVAPAYGGGTEICRLNAPGIPRKHFYPRQGKAPVDGGPVTGGKLTIRRDGNTRIVEAAIPWSEMPAVKKAMQEKRTVKFSFRVNDNDGPAYELAQGRSVSKENFLAFHNDWVTHWANEVEFAFQP